ncbi:MAG: hypothetical protein B6U78_00670 [Candidatus Aenigmarchaeota archaeon ex4484_224]|nr:MAG: hypothetical protein B6U78_00670 [Candidatus Aenigmarchaeota archaeon ex4484_224]
MNDWYRRLLSFFIESNKPIYSEIDKVVQKFRNNKNEDVLIKEGWGRLAGYEVNRFIEYNKDGILSIYYDAKGKVNKNLRLFKNKNFKIKKIKKEFARENEKWYRISSGEKSFEFGYYYSKRNDITFMIFDVKLEDLVEEFLRAIKKYEEYLFRE